MVRGGAGGSWAERCAAAEVEARAAAAGAGGSLSLSKGTNSTGATRKGDAGRECYRARARCALSTNIQRAAEKSPESCAFLTLTLGDWVGGRFVGVSDKREAGRRWNSLRRHLVEWLGVRAFCVVWERHKSGDWHLHAFLVLRRGIRRGWDQARVRRGDYRGAAKPLRSMWERLRRSLPGYGFGRHQLEPVAKPEASGHYLAKYLGKGTWKDDEQVPEGEEKRRYRTISWSLTGWEGRMKARGWSWAGLGGRIHGHAVAALEVLAGGVPGESRMLRLWFGPRWCYYLRRWWEWAGEDAVRTGGPDSFFAVLAIRGERFGMEGWGAWMQLDDWGQGVISPERIGEAWGWAQRLADLVRQRDRVEAQRLTTATA